MADSTKPKKRRLRPAPTLREQAQKAQNASDKPKNKKSSKLKKVFRPLGKPFRPVGKVLRTKPFRIVGRILWPKYLRTALAELRQVTWPNWKQSRQLTFAVIIFSVIFGVFVTLLDYGFDKLFRTVILKH